MTSADMIMDYAGRHPYLTVNDIVAEFGIKLSTARQVLSRLASLGRLSRVGYGGYALPKVKEAFPVGVTEEVVSIYNELHAVLPFTDFCIYSGTVLETLQHHVSTNHAIYVETNRDAVDSVFFRLKDSHENVYRQPDAKFMSDYVDLRLDCIIVKPLVTESPTNIVDGIAVPTLEKLLVDILKDPDFDYLHGAEYDYMFENAVSQYSISTTRLLRYARRRGLQDTIQNKINNSVF